MAQNKIGTKKKIERKKEGIVVIVFVLKNT